MLVTTFVCSTVYAGSFIGSSLIPDGVSFPEGYSGTESVVTLNVCTVPGSPNAALMQPSIGNAINVWNKRTATSANLRSDFLEPGKVDFESAALHELGHCMGLGHPNLGFGAGNGNENFTQSTRGADGVLNLMSGVDGVAGTADDVRSDDRNTHYFHIATNNPFMEPAIVDSATYSNDVASLPMGDLFAANASRAASYLPRYNAPYSEAVMQQGALASEVQRTLAHDDVSTLRYAMSGLDAEQGTSDDYHVLMNYAGISGSDECDISIAMDAAATSFAVCRVVPSYAGSDIHITDASIFFNPEIDWHYNDEPPCSQSLSLPSNAWVGFSLPCAMGVSTSASVADVLGGQLDSAAYDNQWAVFEYAYRANANGGYSGEYRLMALSDELENGRGYWVINTGPSATIDVSGEYSSQLDTAVFIDAQNPRTFGWNLLGQPFRYPVVWADTVVVDPNGDVLSLSQADPSVNTANPTFISTACTSAAQSLDECVVAQQAFTFNRARQDYDRLTLQSGTVEPTQALWVLTAKNNVAVRLQMPESERTTP